jgi:hypothetical protein
MPKVPVRSKAPRRSTKLGLFGVERPKELDYKIPKLRAWNYETCKWTSDMKEIGSLKRTVLSLWTGKLDWHGKPIYVYDLVNLPYATTINIQDMIYLVIMATEDNIQHMNDMPGGYSFMLHSRHGLTGSWGGSQVEVIGDCFSMPDHGVVQMSTKLITKNKIINGRVI